MEPGGSILHSQGLSNNPYPEPNHSISRSDTCFFQFILILSSHLRLGLPKDIFPAGVPVKILKALLPSFILATWPAHLSLLNLITLTILGEVRHLVPLWLLRSSSSPPIVQCQLINLLWPTTTFHSKEVSIPFQLPSLNSV